MRRFVLSLVASMSVFGASAQSIDKILTKDGSEYVGFISEQVPGKHVLVFAEHASLMLKHKEMLNVRTDHYNFDLLSDEAKAIAGALCDTALFKLSSFEYRGRYYENMHISDRMDSTVRVHAFTPRTYIIDWKDLVKTVRISQNEAPYGVRDVVTLKQGERLTGQIVAQTISESLILLQDNGLRREIKNSDILSIMSEKISDKHTLWEQIQLLDRVIFKNGSEAVGFITSRVMGQNINMLSRYAHHSEQYQMKNIQKFQKTPNPDFLPYVVDTVKVLTLNTRKAEMVTLQEKNGVYMMCDTLFQNFIGETSNMTLALSFKNIEHAKNIALYEYVEVNAPSGIKAIFNKKAPSFGIPVGARPVYRTALEKNGDFMTCEIVIDDYGKYFLSIDGFKSGINIGVMAEQVIEKKKKK